MKNSLCFVSLIVFALAFLSPGNTAHAASYEISKIIEIGPASWTPMTQPIKWSPDGTRLSYFKGRTLMMSDTLGNSREIENFTMYPHRYIWISDNELCIDFDEGFAADSSLHQLVRFDVKSGQKTAVEEYISYKYYRDPTGTSGYHGPFLSLEGNPYYYYFTYTSRSKKTGVISENRSVMTGKSEDIGNDHVLWWGKDGLYRIRLDDTDSSRIGPTPSNHLDGTTIMSPDGSHVMHWGTMLRLADSTFIILDTIPFELPPHAAYCAFLFAFFNPKSTEVLFHLTCDDVTGEQVVANRIGVFDYESYNLHIFDPPTGVKDATTPVYAPDGKKIAFLSDGKAYIMYRKLSERGL
jgi:hypothetical protein